MNVYFTGDMTYMALGVVFVGGKLMGHRTERFYSKSSNKWLGNRGARAPRGEQMWRVVHATEAFTLDSLPRCDD